MKNAEKILGKSSYRISSPFGYRINPITKKVEGHNGVDYATYGKKVPCYAPSDGIVLRVSVDKFGGKFVYIRFPKYKRVGLYYHLDRIDVKAEQNIKTGDVVGIVGTTGQSTGVHLHFSWIVDNAKALKYYEATYEDFEQVIFENEEEYMIVKQDVNFDGISASLEAIEKDGRTYLKTSDLSKVGIDVQYREETKEIELSSSVKSVEVLYNGKETFKLQSREIKGRNYFMAADLVKLGLDVSYKDGKPTFDNKIGG